MLVPAAPASRRVLAGLGLGFWLAMAAPAAAQGVFAGGGVHVWTYHNDQARTGRNPNEVVLTPAAVNKDRFGKLLALPVDGDVYAQPLYLSGLVVAGRARNVVYAATQHDSVFAFDADDGTLLWKTSFLTGPDVATLTPGDVRSTDILPEVGITGTPVIRVDPADPTRNTLYVVAKTKRKAAPTPIYEQKLHALDVATGAERPNSPAVIAAAVPGAGTGLDTAATSAAQTDNDGHGHVVFDSRTQNQRAGLVLANNAVYITWSSHGDKTPYHGWVMGYDADTLRQVAAFNATPNGGRAGIWQGAAAPAVDAAGNLYFSTGNGTFEVGLDAGRFPSLGDYGDSVLKLAPDPASTPASPNRNGWGLRVVDYFTPFNQAKLGGPREDNDLGSGGVILLDDQPSGPPHLLAIAGKEGVIYLIDRDAMGRFDPLKDNVVQRLPADPAAVSPVGDVFGMPAALGASLFIVGAPPREADGTPIGGENGPAPMAEFRLAGGKFAVAPAATTRVGFSWKTGTPAVSAAGAAHAIVWIASASGGVPFVPSTLHAFDAADLGRELYNSDQAVKADGSRRDQPGVGIKFAVPTIANGKVYLGSKGEVAVYGLLAP